MAAPAKVSALNSANNNPNFSLDLWTEFNLPRPLVFVQEPDSSRVEVPPSIAPVAEPKPPEPAKPREYIVKDGDNLSKIAEQEKTTWPRLWNKNTDLKDPDVIHIGQVLIIPIESEVLEDRPVPVPIVPVFSAQRGLAAVPRGSSSGNTYSAGYCTWYVKNRRPDLPNSLGNANTWQSRAAAQGLPTGSTPRAGAVGTSTAGDFGHVVYVESVNGDGTITISEMNYRGLYNMNTRTVPANSFLYIY